MALSSCLLSSRLCVAVKIDRSPRLPSTTLSNNLISERCAYTFKSKNTQFFGQQIVANEVKQFISWNFVGGSRTIIRPDLRRKTMRRQSSVIHASWMQSGQIASSAFTLGTVAVLPFYTFMVVAPQAELTKKLVASSIPYIALCIVYAYLLYLSWTPDTIRLMFASKYWLPELPGIAKMFSSEMTLASAWIHLLAVDLFAARQVYFEGLQENIETRHSVSLCLLFCPVGILAHFITKAITRSREKAEHGIR